MLHDALERRVRGVVVGDADVPRLARGRLDDATLDLLAHDGGDAFERLQQRRRHARDAREQRRAALLAERRQAAPARAAADGALEGRERAGACGSDEHVEAARELKGATKLQHVKPLAPHVGVVGRDEVVQLLVRHAVPVEHAREGALVLEARRHDAARLVDARDDGGCEGLDVAGRVAVAPAGRAVHGGALLRGQRPEHPRRRRLSTPHGREARVAAPPAVHVALTRVRVRELRGRAEPVLLLRHAARDLDGLAQLRALARGDQHAAL